MKYKIPCLEKGTQVHFKIFFTCVQRNKESSETSQDQKAFTCFSGSYIANWQWGG